MASFSGIIFGIFAWFVLKYIALSFYTVQQNERAVKTSFGKAIRLENKMTTDDPISEGLTDEEKLRYNYPQLKVIQEVITMTVFALFAIFYMKVPLPKNFLFASLCLVGAVFFMFKDRA